MQDAATLYWWHNDPGTLAMSTDTRKVMWPEHVRWLRSHLGDVYMFLDDNDKPVGTASILGNVLSYTIAPKHRGKGLSTLMLRQIADEHGPLHCNIKPENIASIKAAEAAGHVVHLLTQP